MVPVLAGGPALFGAAYAVLAATGRASHSSCSVSCWPAWGSAASTTEETFDLEFAQTSKWDGDQLFVISAFWDAALQAKQLGVPQ